MLVPKNIASAFLCNLETSSTTWTCLTNSVISVKMTMQTTSLVYVLTLESSKTHSSIHFPSAKWSPTAKYIAKNG